MAPWPAKGEFKHPSSRQGQRQQATGLDIGEQDIVLAKEGNVISYTGLAWRRKCHVAIIKIHTKKTNKANKE